MMFDIVLTGVNGTAKGMEVTVNDIDADNAFAAIEKARSIAKKATNNCRRYDVVYLIRHDFKDAQNV